MKKIVVVCSLVALLFVTSTQNAKALTFGDAALTVGIGTLAGAALGISTLPFYSDGMSKHQKNIWTGAAIGAVVGVMVAGYAGLTEGKNLDEEEEEGTPPANTPPKTGYRPTTDAPMYASLGMRNYASDTAAASVVAWTPVVSVKF